MKMVKLLSLSMALAMAFTVQVSAADKKINKGITLTTSRSMPGYTGQLKTAFANFTANAAFYDFKSASMYGTDFEKTFGTTADASKSLCVDQFTVALQEISGGNGYALADHGVTELLSSFQGYIMEVTHHEHAIGKKLTPKDKVALYSRIEAMLTYVCTNLVPTILSSNPNNEALKTALAQKKADRNLVPGCESVVVVLEALKSHLAPEAKPAPKPLIEEKAVVDPADDAAADDKKEVANNVGGFGNIVDYLPTKKDAAIYAALLWYGYVHFNG